MGSHAILKIKVRSWFQYYTYIDKEIDQYTAERDAYYILRELIISSSPDFRLLGDKPEKLKRLAGELQGLKPGLSEALRVFTAICEQYFKPSEFLKFRELARENGYLPELSGYTLQKRRQLEEEERVRRMMEEKLRREREEQRKKEAERQRLLEEKKRQEEAERMRERMRIREEMRRKKRIRKRKQWILGMTLAIVIGYGMVFLYNRISETAPREEVNRSVFPDMTEDEIVDSGMKCFQDKEYDKAFAYFVDAATYAKNGYAMCKVGAMYEAGQGVYQSYVSARIWYDRAAQIGNAMGMCYLGNMFEFGKGGEKSREKAAEWYKKAWDAGFDEGKVRYDRLNGVKQKESVNGTDNRSKVTRPKKVSLSGTGWTYYGEVNLKNEFEGEGVMKWENGDQYDGHYLAGMRSGFGIYKAREGAEILNCPGCTKYEGDWVKNEKHGKGLCYDVAGKLIYSGQFAYDKPVGKYGVSQVVESQGKKSENYGSEGIKIGEKREGGIVFFVTTDGKHGMVISEAMFTGKWKDAKKWAEKSTIGGYTDWHLPSMKEWAMITASKDRLGITFNNLIYWGIEGAKKAACSYRIENQEQIIQLKKNICAARMVREF